MSNQQTLPSPSDAWEADYRSALAAAEGGQHHRAEAELARLLDGAPTGRRRAQVLNDLAVVCALQGRVDEAANFWDEALVEHPGCAAAQSNRALFFGPPRKLADEPSNERSGPRAADSDGRPTKVAVVSLLFNWPSTGGGIIHTLELATFLARAGFHVRHIFARYDGWGVGKIDAPLPGEYEQECLEFTDEQWTRGQVQSRFRRAVHDFAPDAVIVTDSWNFKPLLAEAVAEFPYLLRMQALECLCPLNNIRLLPGDAQCALHQLATPSACADCVGRLSERSSSLHQAERALSGYDAPEYEERLRRVLRDALAVLVVNPLAQAMIAPYCPRALVVPSGFDPGRFPWPFSPQPPRWTEPDNKAIFIAALEDEGLKGFHVLRDACDLLWQQRRDFRLIATSDSPDDPPPYARYIGWRTQSQLPADMRAADIVAVPAIAQEALGRTAVEAMGVGRPVVASRIGGLPFTISGGAGLLAEPSDPADLARKLELLLDDEPLRAALGRAGRRRFEEYFTWDAMIDRHYRPLLAEARQIAAHRSRDEQAGDSSALAAASVPGT